MEKLKLFYFEGQGNYSLIHDWDEGLTAKIVSEVSFEEALENIKILESYSPTNYNFNFPCDEGELLPHGAYYNETNQGGSRNVEGYISAYTREEAEEVLKEIINSYPVKEYEDNK